MIKSAGIYIGKAIKASVVSLAMVAFLASGILFCCQIQLTHAKARVAQAMPSCHAHKADQATKDSKTCDCCKISKNQSEQAVRAFELVQNFGNDFKIGLIADFLTGITSQVVSYHLAYQGPPRANESLPIYLQVSSLRL